MVVRAVSHFVGSFYPDLEYFSCGSFFQDAFKAHTASVWLFGERHSWGGQKLNSKLKTFPSDVCVPDFAPGFLALLLLLAAPKFLKSFGSFIFILVAALGSTAFECYKYKAFPRTHATDLLLFTAIMHHYSILMSSWSLIISTSSL